MNFKEAVTALYDGKKVRYKGWPKRSYAFIESEYGLFDAVPNTRGLILCHGDDPTADDYELYDEPVLTDIERDWLLNVMKSFLCDVVAITKRSDGADNAYISILYTYNDKSRKNVTYRDEIKFPPFPKGKFYRGMELDHQYTPVELDII